MWQYVASEGVNDILMYTLQDVLGHWEVPIYNDTYVMLFFGLVKKLVSKYFAGSPDEAE